MTSTAETLRSYAGQFPVVLSIPNLTKSVLDAADELDDLHAVADDALALLDQHISEEQRQELGVRIIDRLAKIGKLS